MCNFAPSKRRVIFCMELNSTDWSQYLSHPVFSLISDVADEMGRECFVIGGFVRDIMLNRPSKDIDVVSLGSGIEIAEALCRKIGRKAHLAVFRNFGTAQVKYHNGNETWEVEFVGARRESYSHDSRKPVVEDGSLQDDQNRRDFTINAMAICLNKAHYGMLVDPFDGRKDLQERIIRTPLDPDITFSDDPLRMMRAIRFASQLHFTIHPDTFDAIKRNSERFTIISRERIIDELSKIIRSDIPSRGFIMLDDSGLLSYICPELTALKGIETKNGRGHKDNFYHTLAVLDNVALRSRNEWLRWAALFHDIGKPRSKRYDDKTGWSFHNHDFIGAKMIPGIFRTMKLPMDERMKYVQKMVELHMRPIALVEDVVTDSAVRRLLFDASNDIDDLMILCEADITSRNAEKVRRFLDNFALVRRKLAEIEEKDRIRNFQPPVNGEEIMAYFSLPPSREVGELKKSIKDAILDGIIPNEREAAWQYMLAEAERLGIKRP